MGSGNANGTFAHESALLKWKQNEVPHPEFKED